ncbi:MAG TPA: hypothetical protein VF911_10915 [Thermoanaerobaculia bacterium]
MRTKQPVLTIRKMSVCIALTTVLLSCATVAGDRKISVDAVSEIHVSGDGRKIALVSRYPDGAVVDVIARGTSGAKPILAISEAFLSKRLEDARISSVEWSASGRWLKIEVSDGDVDQSVFVIDVTAGIDTLQEIRAAGRPVTSGSWSRSGDQLYVATSLEDGDVSEADGIYVVYLAEGRVRQLIRGVAVSARLAVADERIITKIQHVDDDVVRHVLVTIDLLTGKLRRLLPESERRPSGATR